MKRFLFASAALIWVALGATPPDMGLRPSTSFIATNVMDQTSAPPVLLNLSAPRYVSTLANLVGCGTDGPSVVVTLGRNTAGDGGGGEWQRVADGTYTGFSTNLVAAGVDCQWVDSEWLRTGVARAARFGVVGDGASDETVALNGLMSSGATNIVLGLGTSRGRLYRITNTVSVPNSIKLLDFDSTRIMAYWPTNQHTPILDIGVAGERTSYLTTKDIFIIQMVPYTWPMDVTTNRALVRVWNPYGCRIGNQILNGGTIAMDVRADVDAQYNTFDQTSALMDNNQYGFMMRSDGSSSMNANLILGGHFGTTALWSGSYAVNNGFSRYGDVIMGTYAHHENQFIGRMYELQNAYASPGEAVPVWLDTGSNNRWDILYNEGSTRIVKVTGTAYNNIIQTTTPAGTAIAPSLDSSGASSGNLFLQQSELYSTLTRNKIFDSGPLARQCWNDGTNFYFPPPFRYVVGSGTTTNSPWLFAPVAAITNMYTEPPGSSRSGMLTIGAGRGIGITIPTVTSKIVYVVPTYAEGKGFGTITSGSPTVTALTDINSFRPYMVNVTGPTGIPAGTYITSIDYPNNSLTLSANATANSTVSMTSFGNRGRVLIRPLLHGGLVDTNLARIKLFGSYSPVVTTTYGLAIQLTSTDAGAPVALEVGTGVEAVEVILAAVTYPLKLESVRVYSPDNIESVISRTIPLVQPYSIATPTNGTWYAGTVIKQLLPSVSNGMGWYVGTSGTAGTLGTVHANSTSGSPVFSVDTASHGLRCGDYIQAQYGLTGRIQWIDLTGTNMCLSANASTTGSGYTNTLSYTAPAFTMFGGVNTNIVSSQNIVGVSGSISMVAGMSAIKVNPDGDYVLTSAPQIANGYEGQIITLYTDDAEANTVTFTDEGTHANSNLYVGGTGTNVVLSAHNSRQFIYTSGSWNLLTH